MTKFIKKRLFEKSWTRRKIISNHFLDFLSLLSPSSFTNSWRSFFDEFYVIELWVFLLLPTSQLVTAAIFCWHTAAAEIKMSHYAKLHSSIYIEEMIHDKWHNFRSSCWKIFHVDLERYFFCHLCLINMRDIQRIFYVIEIIKNATIHDTSKELTGYVCHFIIVW